MTLEYYLKHSLEFKVCAITRAIDRAIKRIYELDRQEPKPYKTAELEFLNEKLNYLLSIYDPKN